MVIARTVAALQSELARLRVAGNRIAFVPTMGNLHAGHHHLMKTARRQDHVVAASIYVNPLQFGPSEDFAAYPRTPDADQQMLADAGVELLFLPEDLDIYPRGRELSTQVDVPGVGSILCGAARPGHFRGVATVVHRLFQIVRPDVALFGKKDYQQLLVIRLMAGDFGLPVDIVGVDTVRDADGLALSSRNAYLSDHERQLAPRLYAGLQELAGRIQSQTKPEKKYDLLERAMAQKLDSAGFRTEYVSVRRQRDLGGPGAGDRALVVLAAAWLGRARLIDNLELELKAPD